MPPHDIDAELSVVGAIMGTPEVLDDIRPILSAEHFFGDQQRVVYDAFCQLADEGVSFDAVVLFGWLKDRGKDRRIGGMSYLAETLAAVPFKANLEAQAKRVRDKWRLRELITSCRRFEAEAYQAENVDAFMEDTERRFLPITSGYQAVKPSGIKDVIRDRFKALDERVRAGTTGMVQTGLASVDRHLIGLQPSDLCYLAARPGMGKTSMAINNIAISTAESGYGVAVFSLEMSREQLVDRMVCAGAGVNSRLIPTGGLTADDWSLVTAEAGRLSKLPIQIDDEGAIPLSALRSKTRRMHAQFEREGTPLRLVILDYLQLMGVAPGPGSRDEKVSENSRGLKSLAKELGLVVCALSQLNREVERRGKTARPQLSDLRESGSIEQDADSVIFLYNHPDHPPTFDDNGTRQDGPAIAEVAKGRHFGTGRAEVMWCPSRTKFFDLERNNYEEHEAW